MKFLTINTPNGSSYSVALQAIQMVTLEVLTDDQIQVRVYHNATCKVNPLLSYNGTNLEEAQRQYEHLLTILGDKENV